jgi:hypothetical protein
MQGKTLKIIISLVLILFVFFSILFTGLCRLSQSNTVASNPVVNAVSNTLSSPSRFKKVLHQITYPGSPSCINYYNFSQLVALEEIDDEIFIPCS